MKKGSDIKEVNEEDLENSDENGVSRNEEEDIKEVNEEYLGISDQNGVSRNEEGDEYYATMMG